jgi:hypothetical protein
MRKGLLLAFLTGALLPFAVGPTNALGQPPSARKATENSARGRKADLYALRQAAMNNGGDPKRGKAEEINEGVAGANYGWPTVDHGPTTDPRFRGPIHHYPTACITGGAFAPADLGWPKPFSGQYFFADFNHGWIKVLDPAKPALAKPFATGLRRPVDLRFAADGSLYVLVRDAWVIDKSFQGGTGALLRIHLRAGKRPKAGSRVKGREKGRPE